MLDPTVTPGLKMPTPVLPWVPDLLGDDWTDHRGIVIVGQNYGQFITGNTKRPKRMSTQRYATAAGWQAFQQTFVNDVVINDNDYYERLAPLLQTTKSNARFVVTDLVRSTLVKRGTPEQRGGILQRFDANIDLNDGDHCKVFGLYADLPESTQWMWDRLTSTKPSTIVALGRAPLCGLLRLFGKYGCPINEHPSGKHWKYKGERWMYNCGINSIQGRIKSGEWHIVNSTTLERRWHIVLVTGRASSNREQPLCELR
jgi:hypothetical protein